MNVANHVPNFDLNRYKNAENMANISHAGKKSMLLNAATLTKLTTAQRHCMEIFYTEFHPNHSLIP
jgi:hypothetical protein